MTIDERGKLRHALAKIPCAISIATDQGAGAKALMCRECPRCLLIQAMVHEDPFSFIEKYILGLPDDGGIKLREDFRRQSVQK